MVVVDERVLTAVDFDAVGGERHQLARSPTGVAQHHVGGLEERLGVGSRPQQPIGAAAVEEVEMGVELDDHRLGDRLADLVLVGLDSDDAMRAVAHEARAELVEQPARASEVDDRPEPCPQPPPVVAVVELAVLAGGALDGVVDGGHLGEAQRGGMMPATGAARERRRRERGDLHGALDFAGRGADGGHPLLGGVSQPGLVDRAEVDRGPVGAPPRAGRFEVQRQRVPGVAVGVGEPAERLEGEIDDPPGEPPVGGVDAAVADPAVPVGFAGSGQGFQPGQRRHQRPHCLGIET